jgi:cell division septum initiation protein DivIVA
VQLLTLQQAIAGINQELQQLRGDKAHLGQQLAATQAAAGQLRQQAANEEAARLMAEQQWRAAADACRLLQSRLQMLEHR